MENRRAFFGKMFGERPAEPQHNQPEKEEDGLTRRSLLKKAVELTAGTALIAALENKSQAASTDSKDNTEFQRQTDELFKATRDINNIVSEAKKTLEVMPTQATDRTLAEQDVMRSYILEHYQAPIKETLGHFFDRYFSFDELTDYTLRDYAKTQLEYIAYDLASVDCYGVLLSVLATKTDHGRPAYAHRDSLIRSDWNELQSWHYSARAADFLPTANTIEPQEIDPRLKQTGVLDDDSQHEVSETLKERPAWASIKRQEQFGDLLDNDNIRRVIQATDCTLAEVYSLIKATIVYKERHPTTKMDDQTILEELLAKREAFKTEIILGPETDSFIHFDFDDKKNPGMFDGNLLDTLWEDTNGKVETSKKQLGDGLTRIDGKQTIKDIYNQLNFAIDNSEGKTTIYFNTHGSPNAIALKSIDENESYGMDMATLAKSLISRLYMSQVNSPKDGGNRTDLAQVTIIFGNCHSHELATGLVKELANAYHEHKYMDLDTGEKQTLQTQLGIPFERLALPTIVTVAQEGSLSYSSVMDRPLRTYRNSIRREGKLTGAFLMRRAQPMSYAWADMTFFYGQKQGQPLEIGALEQKPNQETPRAV